MSVPRRNFLQWLVLGAGATASSMAPYGLARMLAPEKPESRVTKRPQRLILRPPGALSDDKQFQNACIGCGLCAEVCPPRCIQFHKRDGEGDVNTPYIVPQEKGCILCMKCGEVCPTPALKAIPHTKKAIFDQVDMGVAQIDRLTCYPWVDTGICGACVLSCPLGSRAIGFDFANLYRPVVKPDCVGCGLCVEVCPHPSLPIRVVSRSEGTVIHHEIKTSSRSGSVTAPRRKTDEHGSKDGAPPGVLPY